MKVSWMNQQTRNFQAQCVCMCVGCGLAADRQFETVKSSHNPELVFRSGCVGGLPALKRATVITKWRNNASQNVRFLFDYVTIQNLIFNYLTGNPIFNFFFICFTAWLWVNSGLTFANLCPGQFWCYKDKDMRVQSGLDRFSFSVSWRFIWLFFSRMLCHSFHLSKEYQIVAVGSSARTRNKSVLYCVTCCDASQCSWIYFDGVSRHTRDTRSMSVHSLLANRCANAQDLCVSVHSQL